MQLENIDDFRKLESVQAFAGSDYRPPSRGEVRALVALLGWGHFDAHLHLGISFHKSKRVSSTLSEWTRGDQAEASRIPYSAWAMMLLFAGIVTVDELKPPHAKPIRSPQGE